MQIAVGQNEQECHNLLSAPGSRFVRGVEGSRGGVFT
jgi:hypothetical protein